MREGTIVHPKFKTMYISRVAPDDKRVAELINWCSKFHSTGLVPSYGTGSFGNLSFRTEKGFIITASALELKDDLTNDCFLEVISVDMDNKTVSAIGKKEPSSESMLHNAIYEKRKDINAIFHGHSSTILSKSGKLGVISTAKEEAYGSAELVNSVIDILNNENFIVMKNHGFLSLGRSMKEAGDIALQILSRCL